MGDMKKGLREAALWGIGVDGLLPRGEEGLEHFFLGL